MPANAAVTMSDASPSCEAITVKSAEAVDAEGKAAGRENPTRPNRETAKFRR